MQRDSDSKKILKPINRNFDVAGSVSLSVGSLSSGPSSVLLRRQEFSSRRQSLSMGSRVSVTCAVRGGVICAGAVSELVTPATATSICVTTSPAVTLILR